MRNNSLFRLAGWTLGALLVALAAALVYAVLRLNPPAQDLRDVAGFLLISGGVSVVLGVVAFRLGLGTRIPSLAITLALVYLVGAAVVAINVLYTATNMFLSAHDFGLLTILLVFSAVISLFFAFLLSQSLASRLQGLLAVARRVAEGDLSGRVEVRSRDEIGRLAEEFNSMVEQLDQMRAQRERLEASRRDLIAAVSHDLRTPLAGIRAMIEALNDGVITDTETVSRYLRTIQSETHHLTALIDDLFELSQIDAGALKLHLEPTSLADLVSDALGSMSAQAERKHVRLQGQVEGAPGRMPLDAPRMQRVLYNLIQNAIRHTPADGTVTLIVRGAPDRVELTVADTGEGIRETDLPHVFDRFYRGEPARTRDSQPVGGMSDSGGQPNRSEPREPPVHVGAGLGLAIARGIVEAHGGSISATSAPGSGAAFHVVLPSQPAGALAPPAGVMSL